MLLKSSIFSYLLVGCSGLNLGNDGKEVENAGDTGLSEDTDTDDTDTEETVRKRLIRKIQIPKFPMKMI